MNANSNSMASGSPLEDAVQSDFLQGHEPSITYLESKIRNHRQRADRKLTGNTWALVLAAGDGTRLHSLTTTASGVPVPKQFCTLHAGPSLLEEALWRGAAVARHEHLCTVVALQHRRWWNASLAALPIANVIVQPDNRGTANGILLPLLHIMERDPDANIVLLPSDHHVQDESLLGESLRNSIAQLAVHPTDVVVLGIEPKEPDQELGYIVPNYSDEYPAERGSFGVAHFVEKPSAAHARELIGHGGLWNAFILAAKARTLLALFETRVPEIVMEMMGVVRHDLQRVTSSFATFHLYARLPTLDFSRHIMQGQEARLRVLPVPQCGWSDLGTPKRVAEALQRVTRSKSRQTNGMAPMAHLSLADQHSSLHERASPV